MHLKKTIIFGVMALLLLSIASSQISLTPAQKLTSYADANFKETLSYKNMGITSIETSGNLTIIKADIDGKKIRWITSTRRFLKLTK